MTNIKPALSLFLATFFAPLSLVAAPHVDLPPVHVRAVDPLIKVFRDSPVEGDAAATADVARGEHASFQVVVTSAPVDIKSVRCSATPFKLVRYRDGSLPQRIHPYPVSAGVESTTAPTVRFVGYVGSSVSAPEPSHDQLRPAPAMYPDPLLPDAKVDVHAGDNQPIWLTASVPWELTPGDYESTATVTAEILGKPTTATVPLQLKVYPATVKSTRLNVTLWYQMWYFTDHEMPKRYSDAWFDIIRVYARNMREHRQNWGWVETQDAMKFSYDSSGKLQVDFTNFDKWLQLWFDEGFKMIEGQHYGFRTGGWTGPFDVQIWKPGKDGKFAPEKVTPDSPEAREFFSQYFPQLQAHLERKGWLDKYVQHVADEPLDRNADSYTTAAKLLRKFAPKMRIMDACQSEKLAGMIDIWIPQLDHFAKGYDFFRSRQKQGDEVWFYTCMYPQGDYANRFLELPLIKTRLLHWMNYRYGATGYLHWGYNYWPPHVWQDAAEYRFTLLPAGDANIVYPGRNPKKFEVIDSIRYEAMRDGIEDHELLSQVAERDRDLADKLAQQVIKGFTSYDTDVADFRQTRRELLEAASTGAR